MQIRLSGQTQVVSFGYCVELPVKFENFFWRKVMLGFGSVMLNVCNYMKN